MIHLVEYSTETRQFRYTPVLYADPACLPYTDWPCPHGWKPLCCLTQEQYVHKDFILTRDELQSGRISFAEAKERLDELTRPKH